jgi:hypothetical protein
VPVLVADTAVGVSGTEVRVRVFDGADAGLVPTVLVAMTVKV